MEFGNSPLEAEVSFAATARGLAHPKRLQLLNLLAQAERSVESLADTAGLPVATTSAQLQTLRRSGLVARRREGTRIHYRLAGPQVLTLLLALEDVTAAQLATEHLGGTPHEGDEVAVRAIGRDELVAEAQAGRVVVVDVRPAEEFRTAHIPGAVSLPIDELEDHLEGLPADVEIVAYCRGAHCLLSHDAVRMLQDHGRRAAALDHGMLEWRAAGAPVEGAA